jgi:hypothetical protein
MVGALVACGKGLLEYLGRGDLFELFLAFFWGFIYLFERAELRRLRRLDENDAHLPPVSRWRWVMLATFYLILATPPW